MGCSKDDVDSAVCKNFEELKRLIDCYILEYNSYRYQWDLKKMTPAQYRGHLLAS
ncbi:IS3 family transposase [Filibacter tadaridae]|uniref:IS3 family transposase n=1 Tax=Filibacter tadaridae TaxID=2483811 RepID=UPI000F532F18